jgi:hypothetical protein
MADCGFAKPEFWGKANPRSSAALASSGTIASSRSFFISLMNRNFEINRT